MKGRERSVSRRFDGWPTDCLDCAWALSACGLAGLGEKAPQNRPSVRSTSSEGITLERKPMNLQP